MAAQSTVKVQGFDYDHSSALIRFGAFRVDRIKDISYGHEIQGSTKSKGTARQTTAITGGTYDAKDVSVTFYRDGWEEYRRRLGSGYMDKRENISVQASADGKPTFNDLITKARIINVEKGSSEGGNPQEVKVTYQAVSVIEDGLDPIKGFSR